MCKKNRLEKPANKIIRWQLLSDLERAIINSKPLPKLWNIILLINWWWKHQTQNPKYLIGFPIRDRGDELTL